MSSCPCGTGLPYPDCCGVLHRGTVQAATAEALMRSRYAAYALGLEDYVFRTWHPRTRPADLSLDPSMEWTGLDVLGSGEDWVEFVAHYQHGATSDRLQERSRFERRAGRWFYLDGELS